MARRSSAGNTSNPSTKKRRIAQYEHPDKERVNNPPVGLVTPETDPPLAPKKTYQYDPHLDPQLVWAGKAERASFEIPTVSLHVHERLDPKTIIEAVRAKNGNGNGGQLPLFSTAELNPPLRDAVEFYRHRHNWTNRLIAGDSLLVMNSLLEKEGLGGQVQMVYIDPPYGIRYGSNFQPFTNKRDVKDGADEDLTQEPEMLKAFRDTWELGIHSYLTYLRDRLLLARELLNESGSCFVQIGDENLHHVREAVEEVFGADNAIATITFKKTAGQTADFVAGTTDYLLWYAKKKTEAKRKFRPLYRERRLGDEGAEAYTLVELKDGKRRRLGRDELEESSALPDGSKPYRLQLLESQREGRPSGPGTAMYFGVKFDGREFFPHGQRGWSTTREGMKRLCDAGRCAVQGDSLSYVRYLGDFPAIPVTNLWADTQSGSGMDKMYVVQTNIEIIKRAILMTTDPGDLVLDPTCGSGTTAYVAEQWGRRWITCDTSRVAITLAKQRLMTAVFDYYTLAHPDQGVGSGFVYKTVPHVTLKSIANNPEIKEGMSREAIDRAIAKYAETETLYDQPEIDRSKARVTGPFTVEAVPAAAFGRPEVRGIHEPQINADEHRSEVGNIGVHLRSSVVDSSIAREGETLRQSEWRAELLKTGIRAKAGAKIEFVRVEPLPGTRWLSADAETKEEKPRRAVVSFGPEHAPLEQRQVAAALEEAHSLVPKPALVIFASLQFDPEAAKDIDETKWPGVTLLKAQMNGDLVTDDLKKKRSSNESFWLIGQPDVEVVSEQWLVDSGGRRVAPYEICAIVSGLAGLAEINRARPDDLRILANAAARGTLWVDIADAPGGGVNSGKPRGRPGAAEHGGVSPVSGDRPWESGRIGDAARLIEGAGLRDERNRRAIIERLRGDQQDAPGSAAFTIHYPLTTNHYTQVRVHGFDYYNPKSGNVESGGKANIVLWMLDTDYDGRSLYPRQVFFPMAGEKDGWARLAKNLKAEIDPDLIEQYRGTVSLPFEKGKHGRVAVKIVDDRGIESLRLMEVP